MRPMPQRISMQQQSGFNDATCKVSRTEWLTDIKSETDAAAHGAISVEVDGANLPVLSSLAKLFDRYTVQNLTIIYRGAVSTITDGVVYFAFDYDGAAKGVDNISAILKFPGRSVPVYTPESSFPLKFDASTRYVRGTDMRDQLGKVLYFCTTTKKKDTIVGTLFVKYDITLFSLTGS